MRKGVVLFAAVILVMAGAGFTAAQASGFATYFARVAPGGTVQRSSGVQAATRTAVGVYAVTFNRRINSCGWVASVTAATSGYATVTLKSATVLTVRTFASNGGKANRPFALMVQCAP
jgi:hypothetical protein